MTLPIDPVAVTRQALALQPDLSVKPNSPEQLRKVCRQFESVLLQNMLKSMRATVPKGGLLDEGNDAQVYQQMFDAQIVQEAAAHSNLGLGESLYRQLSQHLAQPADAAATAEAGAAGVEPKKE